MATQFYDLGSPFGYVAFCGDAVQIKTSDGVVTFALHAQGKRIAELITAYLEDRRRMVDEYVDEYIEEHGRGERVWR